MYKVSIGRCTDYQYENVEKSVFECLDRLPGIKLKIKVPSKVLVKPNLLKKASPDQAITTHPSVVQAVVRYFQILGCSVIIGDSPGVPHGFNKKILDMVYEATGMMNVARDTGCGLNYDTTPIKVVHEKAVCLKEMSILKAVADVDYVISVGKLKTHVLMMYTGAVKNLFGIIPGRLKMHYYFTMDSPDSFAEHLVDICEYVKPVLSVMDGVEGMEGNGPSAGVKREAGLIMCSENPYALDMAAACMIGINPFDIPTIKAAVRRKAFTGNISDVEMFGMKPGDVSIKPFKLPDTANLKGIPVFEHDKCISCEICNECCPPKAIHMAGGKPTVDLSKCIRCFCCHELCPRKAVVIKDFYEV